MKAFNLMNALRKQGMKILKTVIQHTPLYHPLRNYRLKKRWVKELEEWEKLGSPIPPPHLFKQQLLRSYAIRYGLRVLVETGTYYGDMIYAMKNLFDRIISIELSKSLYEFSRERFKRAKHIEIIHGDSGKVLGALVNKIHQPALFWLDAHWSKGETAKGETITPILEELRHILNSQIYGHVIFIDDARYFGTNPDYPTLQELKSFILSLRSDVEITIEHNIIVVTPKS